jgi:hypothetical protein
MGTAGTPRAFSIEGIGFDLAFDVNISGLMSIYENSKVATSGKAMTKKVKRVPTAESVVLITDWAAKEQLRVFSEQIEDVKFSITYISGDVLKCEGTFNIESDESEENRTTIVIHPADRWTHFPA